MTAVRWVPLKFVRRLLGLISDLRLAIALLLVIALASGIGTAIPQLETAGMEAVPVKGRIPSPSPIG
jgi:hypothetical protein